MNHHYTCLTCGIPFESPKKNKKYCSHKCYAGRYGDVTKECIICHALFTVPYRFRGKQTCSDACHSKNMSIKQSYGSVTITCPGCGEPFETKLRGVYYVDVGEMQPNDLLKYIEDVKIKLSKEEPQPDALRTATTYCSSDCFYRHHYGKESNVVKLKCESCGNEFERPFAGRKAKFCSRKCSNGGVNNGMYGKPGPMLGKLAWNHGKTAKDDPRLAAMGEKISTIIADKIVNGEWNHQPGYKGEHFFSKKNNKEFYLRSSYESKYARMLEEDDQVVSYDHEPFRIPYLLDGAMHNYVPDFFVTRVYGKKQLIEVKPSMFVGGVNAVKFHAARAWCQLNNVDYCIITEVEIESGNIIHQGVI